MKNKNIFYLKVFLNLNLSSGSQCFSVECNPIVSNFTLLLYHHLHKKSRGTLASKNILMHSISYSSIDSLSVTADPFLLDHGFNTKTISYYSFSVEVTAPMTFAVNFEKITFV